MILLLSTAANLYWLGRYSERLKQYDRLLFSSVNTFINKQATAESLHQISSNTENTLHANTQKSILNSVKTAFNWTNDSTLNINTLADLVEYIEHVAMPETVKLIEANTQQVRGVISQDTFELYNLVKRLSDSDSQHAASLQLYACEAAIKSEIDVVKLFWRIGVQIEAIDNALRLKIPFSTNAEKLYELISNLPVNTRWHELDRDAGKLKSKMRAQDFNSLNQSFNNLISEGV